MISYTGLAASQLARYHRNGRVHHAITDRLAAAARRDLAQVTHIPGDLSSDEIEQRYQAALQEIRWRRNAPDDAA